MNNKQKVLGVLRNLVEGDHGFFNFFKGSHLQKKKGNPDLDTIMLENAKLLLFFWTSCVYKLVKYEDFADRAVYCKYINHTQIYQVM